MKCVVSGGNIKILARAIQMLSKIGEEMFVQPQEDSLSFRSVNGSNSSFADITFHENYFSYYAYEDLDESDSLKCKILIRSALTVFKIPSLINKQIETCHIQLDANSTNLCFILKYKNNIIKTHLLPILDCETIRANYKKEGTVNHLCIQPRVLNDVVQNFQQNLLEITIEVLKDKILLRNYIDETSNLSNETRTQLVFGMGEFDEYKINSNTTITFCLKELRAILHFAEILAQPIHIHFDCAGRPIVFICKTLGVESNLVLATLNPDDDLGSQSTTHTRPNSVLKNSAKKPTKAKGKIKSLSKTVFGKLANKYPTNTNTEKIESSDKISNASETSSPNNNNKFNATNSPRVNSAKVIASNSNTNKRENDNSSKQNAFSSLLKRKSNQEIHSPDGGDKDDLVQNSPPKQPSKKAKLIFKKCFQTTFNPESLPGYNNIEVEDSGESD
ncbi:PREDICTED: cell cycle checkpoint control protein RAD9A [Ceratosolen solmsi marchali]|uniref:Cell cycle checkpoint control protein n=1 Tax=Ceratosolen solmsi marchali TaxID=326594 RepID=A0AAJ7E3C9_9HYME|nr:PREDICTED: cell cycle checkpoint control protein RAD9A [Ceratosolen solmsi marchali]